MYPFSTQNGKDFQNLLLVYLDAVFFPCLREQDFRWEMDPMWPEGFRDAAFGFIWGFGLFRQEGWRLENENPSDADTPLIFKGVVFNEMKGAFVSLRLVLKRHSFPVGITNRVLILFL